MKKIKILLLALCLASGCATERKPCQLERICREHRADVLEMLDEYPDATMALMKEIAVLEEETGHYQ
jgi:hypothetical protein